MVYLVKEQLEEGTPGTPEATEAINFVLWLMKFEPNTLYKYGEDDDEGLGAISGLYNLWKS
jgi:hypothetical protein